MVLFCRTAFRITVYQELESMQANAIRSLEGTDSGVVVQSRATKPRRRRLCVIIPTHWSALMGGAQYQAKVLIDRLLQDGDYAIDYLARRVDEHHRPAGYRIIRIGDTQGLHRHSMLFDARKLLRILHAIRPDVIYQQVGCVYTGVAAHYAKHAHCNLVWQIASDIDVTPWHGRRRLDMPLRYLEKRILEYGIRYSTHIVAQTEQQRALLLHHYGREPDALVRNFHPLPTEPLAKTAPVKILWVANIKKVKQPEIFIRLARELGGTGAQFVMIGAPAETREWQASLETQMALAPQLSYLGAQPQEEVNRLLAEAHLLVNTSEYEGFSNTFIQAWMRQVPVVSLNVNPDGVFDGERMGLCAHGDYPTLRDGIARLIAEPQRLRAIARRAQTQAIADYSERNMQPLLRLIAAGGTRRALPR
ncbi:MAG: glycosyltransferase [Gammaproteobacteria bacterium]|nr:glycosyltransferase [Gammaproteobacteria bacterium]